MESFLKSHADAAASINLYQSTYGHKYWASMVPTNNITGITLEAVVHKLHCFSNSIDCKERGKHGKELSTGSYNTANMTEILFQWGSHLDYVKARFDGQNGPNGARFTRSIDYGKSDGGNKKLHLTNLLQNPIVKVTWSAYDSNENNWDFLARMSGLEIVQKDGTVGATCGRALSLHILAR